MIDGGPEATAVGVRPTSKASIRINRRGSERTWVYPRAYSAVRLSIPKPNCSKTQIFDITGESFLYCYRAWLQLMTPLPYENGLLSRDICNRFDPIWVILNNDYSNLCSLEF